MGGLSVEYRQKPEQGVYVAKARIYVDADGNVCAEDDPNVARLLVADGDTLTLDVARSHGLLIEDDDATGAESAQDGADGAESAEAEADSGEADSGDSDASGGQDGGTTEDSPKSRRK